MDINEALREIEDETVEKQQFLEKELRENAEKEQERIKKIHDALQHLDRVLEIESRRRAAQTEQIEQETIQRKDELFEELVLLRKEKMDSMQALFSNLEALNKENAYFAEEESNNLTEALRAWKSESSKSTTAIKARLDDVRSERISLATGLRTTSDKDFREIQQGIMQFEMQFDQRLMNLKTYAEITSKKFEGENKQDLAEFEHEAAALIEAVREEEHEMQFMQTDISKSLSVAIETAQNSMALLGKIIHDKD